QLKVKFSPRAFWMPGLQAPYPLGGCDAGLEELASPLHERTTGHGTAAASVIGQPGSAASWSEQRSWYSSTRATQSTLSRPVERLPAAAGREGGSWGTLRVSSSSRIGLVLATFSRASSSGWARLGSSASCASASSFLRAAVSARFALASDSPVRPWTVRHV